MQHPYHSYRPRPDIRIIRIVRVPKRMPNTNVSRYAADRPGDRRESLAILLRVMAVREPVTESYRRDANLRVVRSGRYPESWPRFAFTGMFARPVTPVTRRTVPAIIQPEN